MSGRTSLTAPRRELRKLVASPKMPEAVAKLGLPPPPEPTKPARFAKNGGTAKTGKPEPPSEDPAIAAERAAAKAARQAAAKRVEALLRARFPAVFCTPSVPLAIGIHQQILEVAGDDIAHQELAAFFHWWVHRYDYLDAVAHGEPRRNLDSTEAGMPTEDQQRDAARRVYGPSAEAVLERIKARLAGDVLEEAGIGAQVKGPKGA